VETSMPQKNEARLLVNKQMEILQWLEKAKSTGNTELHLRNPKTNKEIVLDLNDLGGSLRKLQDHLNK
jgi:hypothetical protein